MTGFAMTPQKTIAEIELTGRFVWIARLLLWIAAKIINSPIRYRKTLSVLELQ
jgi:hypothetical protein